MCVRVCVGVRVCVRVCVGVRVCVRVCVFLIANKIKHNHRLWKGEESEYFVVDWILD